MNRQMKVLRCVLLLGVLALTAACADRQAEADDVAPGVLAAGGRGYISFDINVPTLTSPLTRALADPTDAEDAINSAMLFLFSSSGPTDDDTKRYFHSAYVVKGYDHNYLLDGKDSVSTGTEGWKRMKSRVVPVSFDGLADNAHLYAYILLNRDGSDNVNLIANGDPMVVMGNLADGKTALITRSTTFRDFSRLRFSCDPNTPFMTNAPMAKSNGEGGYTIYTMPDISRCIYVDSAHAMQHPAKLFVERSVAKLQLVADNALSDKLVQAPTITYDKANIRWVADTRAQQYTFNMRQLPFDHTKSATTRDWLTYTGQSNTSHRFIDANPIGTADDEQLYRIHWAEDSIYYFTEAQSLTTTDPSGLEAGGEVANTHKDASHNFQGPMDNLIGQSCNYHENTMNEWGLTQDKTTRLRIRVPISAGTGDDNKPVYNESFFTIDNDQSRDVIYHVDATTVRAADRSFMSDYVATWLAKHLPACTAFTTWVASHTSLSAYNATNYTSLLTTTILENHWRNGSNDTDDDKNFPEQYGYGAIKLRMSAAVPTDAQGDFPVKALNDWVNQQLPLRFYFRGYAYYKVLVRHFTDQGDDAGKVAKPATTKSTAYNTVYAHTTDADLARKYLGRYGMVRNHWYVINLKAIRHIGEPGNPAVNPVPDDEDNWYIDADVLINQWAERKQHEVLK